MRMKIILQKLYDAHYNDYVKLSIYKDLVDAALSGRDFAYFFENFQHVRELANEEKLYYENVSPNENETGVRCVKVWGWVCT